MAHRLAFALLGLACCIWLALSSHLMAQGQMNAWGNLRTGHYQANGPVHAVHVQGSTLYMAGSFTALGLPVPGCALYSQGRWQAPAWTAEHQVEAASASPEGGWFVALRRRDTTQLLKLQANGAASFWPVKVVGTVHALTWAGGQLWVGGQFYLADSPAVRNLLVCLPTGTLNRKIILQPNGAVYSICPAGTQLWLGGGFDRIDTLARQRIAALDPLTGRIKPYGPKSGGAVRQLLLSAQGTTVYALGDFQRLGDSSRRYLAAWRADTGAILPWNPAPDMAPRCMAHVPRGLLIAGPFTRMADSSRIRLALFDPLSGKWPKWGPTLPEAPACMAVQGAQVLLPVSETQQAGTTYRHTIALDGQTGAPVRFSGPDGMPSLMVASGGNVLVAGKFALTGIVPRGGLASMDLTTGQIGSLNTRISGKGILAMQTDGAGGLWLGGDFDSLAGWPAQNIARLILATQKPDTNCTLAFDGTVTQMGMLAGLGLWVSGDFSQVGDVQRRHLALLDPVKCQLLLWNPGCDGEVRQILPHGSKLLAAGNFGSIGGITRNHLAVLDPMTGAASTLWNPKPNQEVFGMRLLSTKLLAWGAFRNIGSQDLPYIAQLDHLAGESTGWYCRGDGAVHSMLDWGSSWLLAGELEAWGNAIVANSVVVSPDSGQMLSQGPLFDGVVHRLLAFPGGWLAQGEFRKVNGKPVPGLALFVR